MATYKVIHKSGSYQTAQDVKNIISYITRQDKTASDGITGGAVLPEIAACAMNRVTEVYCKKSGPHLRHSVLSFSPDEPITPRQAKAVAKECVRYYEDEYQIIAAVHEDRDHLHIHFAMNTTSYRTGRKYPGDKKDYYRFLNHIKEAVSPYGIRVQISK